MAASRCIICIGANGMARDTWSRRRNTMAIFFLGIGAATVTTGFARMNGTSCRDRAIDRDLPPDRDSDARRPCRASGVRSASTRCGGNLDLGFLGTTGLIRFVFKCNTPGKLRSSCRNDVTLL
jgi:hypothetical protein